MGDDNFGIVEKDDPILAADSEGNHISSKETLPYVDKNTFGNIFEAETEQFLLDIVRCSNQYDIAEASVIGAKIAENVTIDNVIGVDCAGDIRSDGFGASGDVRCDGFGTLVQVESDGIGGSGHVETDCAKGSGQVDTNVHDFETSDSDFAPKDGPLSDSDSDSSNPSWLFDDFEGSSDDNIFDESSECQSGRAKYKAFKKKLKKKSEKRVKVQTGRATKTSATEDWYSDVSDDELGSVRGSDDDVQRRVQPQSFPVFNEKMEMKYFEMEVGTLFKNVAEYRVVLRDWAVRKGFDLSYKKNDKKRVTAECKNGCTFRIHASKLKSVDTFMVKTINGEHSCGWRFDNQLANYKYLGKRMEAYVRDHPNETTAKLQSKIYSKVKVTVNKYKAMRAKQTALKRIQGDWDEQYSRLRDYCETVRVYNPGSTLLIGVNRSLPDPIFERMFFSLGAMINGFLAGCRPIIGLDGCFLKTVYGGQLLAAIGRDGNDNMYPIALAVVPIERRETWSWFLKELHNVIGDPIEHGWTYISDRQKGLCEVFKDEYPRVHHRFCLRHMYENFKANFPGLLLKDLFWKAASTANVNEFERIMKSIQAANPKVGIKECAYEWLERIPAETWARSHFPPGPKCDILVNNLCESFNNYILDARDKPIITMFEMIRARLMNRIQVKRIAMEKYNGIICPNILKKLKILIDVAKGWHANWAGQEEYEVTQNWYKHSVNLATMTCTCGMFQLTGYPCYHAMACINTYGKKVEDFVHPCYTKDVYLSVYQYMVHPVPGPNDYVKTGSESLKPPIVHKRTGRPRKMRRKSADERNKSSSKKDKTADQRRKNSYERNESADGHETNTIISTRKGFTVTCSKCLKQGHNKSSCRNPFHPNSPLLKNRERQSDANMGQFEANPNNVPNSEQSVTTNVDTQLPPRPTRGSGRGVGGRCGSRGVVSSINGRGNGENGRATGVNGRGASFDCRGVGGRSGSRGGVNGRDVVATGIGPNASADGNESAIGRFYNSFRHDALTSGQVGTSNAGGSAVPVVGTTKRSKAATVNEVLENIRKRKRTWKPSL